MTDRRAERDALLARRFVTLADTLVDDFDVVDLLTRLVTSVVELLPVEEAGLLLLDEQDAPQLMAATSESTRLLELFQLESREGGPSLEALRSGRSISVADLGEEGRRWPLFSRHAEGLGFASVHAMPLRLRREVIGVLNLFGRRGALSEEDLVVGQSLADMATIGLLQQRTTALAQLEAQQLQNALTTRVVIEQAKGVLAEAGGLDMELAFEALRGYARRHQQKLADVAEQLVSRSLPPSAVV